MGRGRIGRDGFTLIEVVAAFVIFAAGVLAALQLSAALASQVGRATIRSEVVTLAHERMEEVKATDYDDLSTGTEVEDLTVAGVDYVRTTVISSYADRTFALEVTVAPSDATSSLPSQSLSSYVYGSW